MSNSLIYPYSRRRGFGRPAQSAGNVAGMEPVVALDMRQGPFNRQYGTWRDPVQLSNPYSDYELADDGFRCKTNSARISLITCYNPLLRGQIAENGSFSVILRHKIPTFAAAQHFGITRGVPRIVASVPYSNKIIYWDVGGTGGGQRISWAPGQPDAWWQQYNTFVFTAGPRGKRIYNDGKIQAQNTTPIDTNFYDDPWVINGGVDPGQAGAVYQIFSFYPFQFEDRFGEWVSKDDNVFELFEKPLEHTFSYTLLSQGEEPPPGDDHIVNLPAVDVATEVPAPTVTATVTNTVTLGNAVELLTDVAVPTVEAPVNQNVILGAPVVLGFNVPVPTIDVPVDHQVNLPAVQTEYATRVGSVVAGADAVITLGNAVDLAFVVPPPPVEGQITYTSTVPAVTLELQARVGTTEGEPFLPPSIVVPTQNQTLQFNQTSVIPAPLFDPGTGDNVNWSLFVDEFSGQPGVTNFTINPTTGDINYTIAQLTTDANVQALNTKGPYNITRRVTTSVGNDDESWQIGVNVGSYTLEFTPGSKLVTWETATPLARGLQTDKDLSAPVTQTYTVT